MTVLRRARLDSRVALLGRRLVADSRVCAAVGTVIRPTVAPGLQWTTQQEAQSFERLEHVLRGSRIAALLSRMVAWPESAWPDAKVKAWLRQAWGEDVEAGIQMVGCAVVAAVLTHTVLLGVFGVPVHTLGWSLRVVLFAAGLAVVWRPGAMAAAWTGKTAR